MASSTTLFYSTRSSTLFSILTVGLGMLCDSFLYALVVPLLPSFLERRTNVLPQDVQRAISLTLAVYALCASIGSPFAGLLADRLPRRSMPFLASLAFLAAGTAMFMTVTTFPLLVIARALQGFSTAIVWTVGLAMLLDKVGAARMGVTMGSIFGVLGVAQLAAPVLGGWLYENAGMGALTAISLGIVALDFLMRLAVIETTGAGIPSESDDSDSVGERTTSDSSDRHGSTQTQDTQQTRLLPSDHATTDTQRTKYPLPKYFLSHASSFPVLILIQDPRILTAQVVTFTQAFQFSAIDATFPIELASRLGFNSGLISLMILPWIIPFVILDPIFGRLLDRVGPKAPALAGLTSWAIILLLVHVPILIIERGNRQLGIAVWAGLMVLNGASAAAVGSGGIVAAGEVAEGYTKAHPDVMVRKDGRGPFAQLFAINSIVFHIGLAAGPTAAGALRLTIGYANMNVVLSVLLSFTCLICYIYMDGWPIYGRGYESQIATDAYDDEVTQTEIQT